MDKATFTKLVGKRIAQLRKKKGWTQQRLGDALLKDRQEIYHIEHGDHNLTLYLARRIAQALEVTLDELSDVD